MRKPKVKVKRRVVKHTKPDRLDRVFQLRLGEADYVGLKELSVRWEASMGEVLRSMVRDALEFTRGCR